MVDLYHQLDYNIGVPQFDIAEAEAHFSELIEKAILGEEVIVAKDNKPVAKIVPLQPAIRKPGTGKGKILYISPDFDAPLKDFADYE
jgi:prevent-host-death family protein